MTTTIISPLIAPPPAALKNPEKKKFREKSLLQIFSGARYDSAGKAPHIWRGMNMGRFQARQSDFASQLPRSPAQGAVGDWTIQGLDCHLRVSGKSWRICTTSYFILMPSLQ